MFIKNLANYQVTGSLAYSWGVDYRDVIIHHIADAVPGFIRVSYEVKTTNSGRLLLTEILDVADFFSWYRVKHLHNHGNYV